MSNEVVIGHVCYKGNHIALEGESDYGVCGSHYYAEIRLSVVETRSNPRGEALPSAEVIAEELAGVVSYREKRNWEDYNASTDNE